MPLEMIMLHTIKDKLFNDYSKDNIRKNRGC